MNSLATRIVCVTLMLAAGRSAGAAPEPGQQSGIPRLRSAAQVRHLPEADLTVSAAPTLEGGAVVDATGDDLAFRKTIRPDGTFTLDIASARDRVVIDVTGQGVTVSRNRKRVTLKLGDDNEESVDAVARLLADSRAIRRLRLAGAAALDADDASASAVTLLLSDAVVGMLTGDSGAPSRVARHLSQSLRARLRNVATTDCYYDWEGRVMAAMYELEDCVEQSGPWKLSVRLLCSARWALMVESYWVTFLSCSGFNF
jgi:hypothetical protein